MVAIVAGQGLGLLNTSLGLLGSSGQLGVAGQGRSGEGVYVNATTGNLVVQQQDEWLVGLGPDAGISRTYNSLGTGVDDNGDNWRLGLSRQIIAGTGSWGAVGSTMVRVGEDGSQVSYTYNGTTYVSKSGGGSFDTLSWDSANNRWIWQDGDTQVKEYYEVTNATTKAARLKQVSDPDNKRLTLTYTGDLLTRVATSNGDYIDIEYETGTAVGNGQSKSRNIKSLTTTYASGTGQASIKRVSYSYDDYNRLSQVTVDLTPADKSITDGVTYWTKYTYVDTSSRLIKTIKQSDDSLLSFTYESGKVKTITDVRGSDTTRVTTFSYGSGATAGTVDITDALGQITTLTYEQTGDETKQGQLLSIKSPAVGGKTTEQVFTYDSNGNVATVKDALGNITVYQYDANGNRTYERDAQNNVVARTYSTTNQLLTQTSYIDRDPDGAGSGAPTQALTTRYVYETASGKTHQLRYVITAQGYVTQYVYNDNVNGNGQLSKTVQYSADAYDLSGLSASQVPTLAQMATWSGSKAATGLPTVYSYNALGQLDTQTTYASVNASGEGLTDGTQSVTQFVYDQAGNLLKKIDGRQKTTEYLYDGLNRITSVKDPASGLYAVTIYTDNTRQTQVTSLNGLVTTSTYDQAGRLLTVARADGSTALGTTTYTYDKLGRLTAVTQPTGEKSYYLYDAASRKVGQIDGEGALTEFVYDAKDQVVRTLRYSALVSATMLSRVAAGTGGLPSNLLSTSAVSAWSYATSGAITGLSNGTSNGTAAEGTLGEQTRWIQQTAGTTAGESSLSSLLTPVTPGSRYDFSVYASATNATATLKVQYCDSAGNAVGSLVTLDTLTGGSQATDRRLQGFLTIPTTPAGITQVKLVVTKSGSTSTAQSSQLKITRALVSPATAGQTQVSITDIRPPVSGQNDRSQWNVYDAAGRLIKTITAVYEANVSQFRGAVIEYRYDGAGRLTDTIEYATRLGSTQMDAIRAPGATLTAANGTLVATNAITGTTVTTSITLTQDAANDRRSRVFYDADGRITGQLDAENYYTESQYDKAGRLVRSRRYATPITATVADDATSVPASAIQTQIYTGLVGGADQSTYYLYNARGQVKAVIDAELFATAYEYDAAGNKTKETRYAAQTVTSAGTGTVLLGTTSTGTTRYVVADATKDHVTSYEYDDDNRLKRSMSQPSGLETVYAYDVQGNLLKTTAAVGQTEQRITTRRYDKLGRVTAELSAEGGKALAALATTATQQQIDNVWKQYGTQYLYDDSGHRIATITPDGTGTTGNKTAYYYDKAGRVTHSINALGEVSTYTYNAFGDVTEQRRLRDRLASPGSYGGGLKTQALIDAVDAKKSTSLDSIVTSTYDRAGWLLKRQDTLGTIASYTYNTFGEVKSQYTPNTGDGLYTESTYDRRGLVKTVKHGDGDTQVYDTSSTTYDAFGQLSSRTDVRGNVTYYFNDKLGRQILVTEPGSDTRYTAWRYDAFGRVMAVDDPQGNTSTYAYNDVDRSMTITLGGVTTTTRYDRLGQTVEQVDGRGNRTKYSYNADGQLTRTEHYSATGLLLAGTTSSTQYDYAGRVANTVSEDSNNTQITYDAANRVITRVVDSANGGLALTSQYLYDGLGNAVWSRDAAGVWTQTAYDSRGRVTSVTIDPPSIPGTDSGVGTTGIAGANLVANPTAAPLNQVTTFSYNEDNTVLRVTRGAGSDRPEVTAYQYDSLGRRIKETRDPDGLSLWTAYAYDAGGNMVASMDKLGNITRYIYNASGLVTHVIDATGAVVKTDYDSNGRVTRTLAYADRISATDLASLGPTATWLDVQTKLPTTASNNASNQINYKVYDARGQLTWSIDALGYATQREYDASGNVARVTRYAAKPTAFNTAGAVVEGRVSFAAPTLSTANASANQVDQYVYDGANRPTWHIDALGYATRTVYPSTGTVYEYRYANAVKYPTGWTAGTLVSAISLRSAEPGTNEVVTTPYLVSNADLDHQSTTLYDRLGRVNFAYDALGYMTAYTYDATGHLQSKTRLTAEASLNDDFTNPGNAKTTYEYDAAGNLSKVTDAEGVITLNTYDKAGRLTDTTVAWGTSDASTTHYVLDAAGRVTEEVRAYGKAEQASTRYVLDALGRRTGVIDPRGIELAETDSDAALKFRKALGGAYVDGNNAKSYTLLTAEQKTYLLGLYTTQQEFDKVGRLTKSTDALGGITRTEYDAFGNAVKVTAPNNSVGYFYFDNNNQATWHVDPLNHATRTEYDAFGSVTKVTRFVAEVQNAQLLGTGVAPVVDPANTSTAGLYITSTTGKDAITQIAHDLLGRQTTITDAENKSETIAYDAFGNKKSFTNKLGGVYSYTYDKLGRVVTETAPEKVKELDANGQIKLTNNQPVLKDVITRFEYDARGNVTKKVEGDGLVGQQRTTTYSYDLLDRLKTTTGEAMTVYSAVTGTETPNQAPMEERWYDKRGNLIEVQAADGGRTLTYWDALDRKVAEVSPTGTLTQWDYADDGKVVAQRVYGDALTIAAGPRGGTRPSAVNAANVRETVYAYDRQYDAATGLTYAVTKTTVKNVTVGSRVDGGAYSVTTGDVTTSQVYDKTGNVIKETDGRGSITYSYYDKLGNKTLQVDAERYVTQWAYDEAGNVKSQTRYANALPTAVTVGIESSQADLSNAVPTASDKRTTEYSYDRMNRRTEERVLNVTYSELNAGNGNVSDKTGTVTTKYAYNALGAVTQKTDALNQVTDMTYDNQGRLIRTKLPGFVDWQSDSVNPITDVEYNALGLEGRVVQRGKDEAGEADDRITVYVYGKNGVRTAETDAAGNTTTYAYDLMGRVTRRDILRKDADGVSNNDRLTVSYNLAGQQVEQSTYTKLSTETAYRLLKSEQIGYNAWGQMTLKGENNGAQRKIEYDTAGRIWRSNATDSGAVSVYYYDANGNATLELTSSQYDLSSSSILVDNSAASLNAVLQANKANPKFNVYDKLNQLIDSYEPSMSGQSQAGSVVARTDTVTTTTSQDPFASGSLGFTGTYGVSSRLDGAIDRYSQNGTLIHIVKLDLPSLNVYGRTALRIKLVTNVPYSYTDRGGATVNSNYSATKDFYVPYGETNLRNLSGSPENLSLWGSPKYVATNEIVNKVVGGFGGDGQTYNSKLEIYQVLDGGAEVLVTTIVETRQGESTTRAGTVAAKPPVFSISSSSTGKMIFEVAPTSSTVNLGVRIRGSQSDYSKTTLLPLTANGSPVAGRYAVDWVGIFSTNQDYEFKFEALKSNGEKIAGSSGIISVSSGGIPVLVSQTADPRPDLITYTYNHYLDWTLGAAAAFELNIHRKQVYNAYGEQIRQISYKRDAQNAPVEIVTELAYNALGKLIEKKDPTVSITLANGFQDLTARPTTRWYYDALGRLIGTKDANGNINTSSLLSISPSDQPIIVNEYHANRRLVESVAGSGNYDQAREGVKRSQYDVFGQLRRSANENWDGITAITPYATTYGYDANGYLTSIDRPGAADENYEVDSLGNRIATTLAPDSGGTRYRETTQYDALGRIVKTTTAFNRSTSYSYEWIATMAGGGGWRRTTFTADGTLIDDTDIFGRIRWHKDLGNHATTYRYNNAGLLSGQTSLAADGAAPNLSQALIASLVYTGQNISFSYYGNGLLKDTVDNAESHLTWTQYRYDDRGNRIFEGYARNYGTVTNPSWEYFQYSEATYDDANRLVRIWDAKSDISYEYDAVGNRRRVLSKYHDGAQGGLQTQDFWYAYDNMNRFTLTMGALNSANGNTRGTSASDSGVWIVTGSNGRVIGYDYASQRKSALTASGTESYSYDAEGYLEEVKLNGNRIAWRDNDARGNVMVMEETNGEGVTRHTYTYDADNNVRTDKQEFLKNGESSYKQKAFTENTLMASGALDISVRKEYKDDGSTVNNTVTTDYDYVLWDDAKQSKIGIKATNPGVTRTWEPGSTTLSYDLNGHIERSYDIAGNRYFYYNTDADGRVLRREEVDGPDKKPSKQNRVAAERSALLYQNYYFFNGKEVGTVAKDDPSALLKDYSQALLTKRDAYYKRNAVVSADFDQNYQPIGTNYPGRTGSVYTVSRAGETLQNIALAVWGDSSLWYLIADANGLTGTSQLTQGQRLVIPNKVTNIHNNTQTSRPYDAGQALGDISPTLPDPPPPPKKGCGAMGMIIMIVVAVVVTAITAGALSGATGTLFQLMQAGFQTMAAGITGGLGISSAVGSLGMTGFAVAGAAGSVASQLVGMATGDVQKFSWSSVAISAVGSVVGGKFAGIGGKGWEGAALRAGLGNAATQAVGVATGLQKKFDWRNVAAAAIGGGLTSALTNDGAIKANTVDGFTRRVAGGMLTGAARAALNETKPNWDVIAADSFGNALGDAVVQSIKDSDSVKVPKKTFAQDVAERMAASNPYGRDLAPSSAGNASFSDMDAQMRPALYVPGKDDPQGISVSTRDSMDDKVLAMLAELKDANTLKNSSRLREIAAATTEFNAGQIAGKSPEDTAFGISLTYQDVYKRDQSAIWFGLATYAVGKVGEAYQLANAADIGTLGLDREDTSILRKGLFEGNKEIYKSMMTAEMVYQAGGSQAVRAMQDAGVSFGGGSLNDPAVREFRYRLADSFDLRDQAKAAFSSGDEQRANQLIGQSLKASADFEQRVVLQQYYDKSYTSGGTSKTLREALMTIGPDFMKGSAISRVATEYNSEVRILDKSVRFSGKDLGNVAERMPFVYGNASAFMSAVTSGGGNGLSAQQRIYQDQTQMIQRTWGMQRWLSSQGAKSI